MKRFIMIPFLAIALMLCAKTGYAQEKADILKPIQKNYYRNSLKIDSVKAEQVSQIQHSYKLGLSLIMADTALNEAAKRVKISALIEVKNKKLKTLLSPAQQEKIIPTTERITSKAQR